MYRRGTLSRLDSSVQGIVVGASQQQTADRFYKLGLIPNAITVADAVWTPPAD